MKHIDRVQYYFDQTQLYLAKNAGIRVRAQIIRDLIGEITNGHILDIGCGDGSLSLQFLSLSNHITLLDVSWNMLLLADRKVPVSNKHQVNLCNVDFLDFTSEQLFDLVLCVGVLAHAPVIQAVLQQIVRLLPPGGQCLIQFTDQEQLMARTAFLFYRLRCLLRDSYDYPINLIRRSEMQSLVEQNGLKLVKEQSYWAMVPGISILPTKLVSQFLLRLYQNRHTARLGSEKIWLLIKE